MLPGQDESQTMESPSTQVVPHNLSSTPPFPDEIDLLSVTVQDLSKHMGEGKITSVQLVVACLERIEANNHKGLDLCAVIETSPLHIMLPIAAALDDERKAGQVRGPLHGIPMLVKDNIATDVSLGMETTAGSLALLGSKVPRDAHVIARLREAGAIILGKANLTEFANFKGKIPKGWSPRGGQTQSPYVVGGYAAGGDLGASSSGSAVGVCAGFVPVALGTDTGASIIFPSERSALFAIRPTLGLTSRSGIVPIAHSQDTVGPMGKSAWDVAAVLNAMVGYDPADSATEASKGKTSDYTTAITPDGLRGLRIGVPRSHFYDATKTKVRPDVYAATEAALKKLEALGVTLVDPADLPSIEELWDDPSKATKLFYEFKEDIESYLGGLSDCKVKTLADLIEFNKAHADEELPNGPSSQEIFLQALQTQGTASQEYLDVVARLKDIADTRGLTAVFNQHRLNAIVIPSCTESIIPYPLATASITPAVLAGWPICTVPLGYHTSPNKLGMPFGLSFTARAFDERVLFRIMSGFEANFEKRRVPAQLQSSKGM